jgi:hypothetical protein
MTCSLKSFVLILFERVDKRVMTCSLKSFVLILFERVLVRTSLKLLPETSFGGGGGSTCRQNLQSLLVLCFCLCQKATASLFLCHCLQQGHGVTNLHTFKKQTETHPHMYVHTHAHTNTLDMSASCRHPSEKKGSPPKTFVQRPESGPKAAKADVANAPKAADTPKK